MAVHAAAPCPIEVKRQMIDWWGPILLEYYAGTEGNGSTVITSGSTVLFGKLGTNPAAVPPAGLLTNRLPSTITNPQSAAVWASFSALRARSTLRTSVCQFQCGIYCTG